jgi:hypothetical protein
MAWNRSKPAAGGNVESAPVRANFQALELSLYGKNLLGNAEMLIWPAGSSSGQDQPPAHFAKVGTPDIKLVSGGKRTRNSARVTYSGSGTDGLSQELIPTTAYTGQYDGAPFSGCVWVKSNSVGVTVKLTDGVITTTSSAHSGSDDWELLKIQGHTVDASSTKLSFAAHITATGYMEINQPTVVFGPVAPDDTIPSEFIEGTIQFPIISTITTGDLAGGKFCPWRPFFVADVSIQVGTAPTSAAVKIQLQKWDGASWISVYKTTSPLTLTTGKFAATLVPNSTNSKDSTGGAGVKTWGRSFEGLGGSSGSITATGLKNRRLKIKITAGAGAADGEVCIRVLQPKRPLAVQIRPQDFT